MLPVVQPASCLPVVRTHQLVGLAVSATSATPTEQEFAINRFDLPYLNTMTGSARAGNDKPSPLVTGLFEFDPNNAINHAMIGAEMRTPNHAATRTTNFCLYQRSAPIGDDQHGARRALKELHHDALQPLGRHVRRIRDRDHDAALACP